MFDFLIVYEVVCFGEYACHWLLLYFQIILILLSLKYFDTFISLFVFSDIRLHPFFKFKIFDCNWVLPISISLSLDIFTQNPSPGLILFKIVRLASFIALVKTPFGDVTLHWLFLYAQIIFALGILVFGLKLFVLLPIRFQPECKFSVIALDCGERKVKLKIIDKRRLFRKLLLLSLSRTWA